MAEEGNGDFAAKAKELNPPAAAASSPVDKHKLVYVVFVLLGIGTLLPWNFFISVSAYWWFKYRTVNATFDEFTDSNADGDPAFPSFNPMQKAWGPQVWPQHGFLFSRLVCHLSNNDIFGLKKGF